LIAEKFKEVFLLKKLLLSFVLVFGIVATAVLAMTAEDVKTQTTDYYMANNPHYLFGI
jgi:hypothetical protein